MKWSMMTYSYMHEIKNRRPQPQTIITQVFMMMHCYIVEVVFI